jgi:glycerophosphoryl diester phosphodiesterase
VGPFRPLLIAHRGDPAHAPENTLASFHRAIAKGARAVEMDVRRLADGAWVVFHDPHLGRTTDSSGRLSRLSRKSAASLDAGGWFSPRFRGERVPLLSEAIRLCRSRRVPIFLDVKSAGGERELAALLRRSGWLGEASVLAGTYPSLRRWRRLLPGRPLFWVTGCRQRVEPRKIARARGLRLAGFVAYKGAVGRRAVERVHRAGMKVFVWTVRTRAELQRWARLGVDGMMSERWPAPSI